MRTITARTTLAAICIGAALTLTGCSASASTSGSAAPKAAAAPADLSGNWKQSNSKSTDSWQAATINGDTIEVDWVSDKGSTKSLYWAGSYTAPTKSGDYSWTSTADKSKTESALLASSDSTKKFTYSAAAQTVSYSVSALGTTTTVTLKKMP